MNRVAVTGSTGFIGGNLVRKLLESGEKVRLLIRDTSRIQPLRDLPVEYSQADLLDKSSLIRGLKDCSRLYHLAAYAKNWAPDKEVFLRINLEGLRNILEASIEEGLKKVVYVSSSVVNGPSRDGPVSEKTSRDHIPYFTDYEESKARAEKIIPEYLAKNLEVTIARPTRVFGPGKLNEANSVTRIIKYYLKLRLCPLLDRGQQVGNYVYVDDVVEGLRLLMERGRNGEAYILGGENISLAGFYDLLEAVSGIKAIRMKIPVSLAKAVANLESWKAENFKIYPFITKGWVMTFLQNWACSHQKASLELGYQPRSLKEGLKLTLEWFGYKTPGR